MTAPNPLQVRYWAISIFSSRTFWLNVVAFCIVVLSATDVLAIVPPAWMPTYSAVLAVLNIIMRTVTVRPVAFIAPGTTQIVAVTKIDPPPPAAVTD